MKDPQNQNVSTERIAKTAWLFVAMAYLTILDAFVKASWLAPFTSAFIVAFIVVEFKSIPRLQRVAGIVLTVVGTAGALWSGKWAAVLPDAVARSRNFLLLFYAVSWLQLPAAGSPSLHAVRAAILSQPPGRRFLFLSYGVHVLGSILNLAGMSLFSTVTREEKDPVLKRRIAMALIQGFTSASCWSPFFVGMIVVLVAVPTLKWRDVAPSGAALAMALILSGWLYDRFVIRQDATSAHAPGSSPLSRLEIWRAIFILGLLIAAVIVMVEFVRVSIPVALGLVGPPFAVGWYILIAYRTETAARRTADLAGRVVASLPSLRNEALVFVAANILGLGVASAVPTADLGSAILRIVPWADARIFLLYATFVGCGFVGLHPIIVVLFIGSVLPPEALGLRDWIVGTIYLGNWGLCTMISPFSGTTLYMARQTGTPAHIIAWQWASRPTLIQALVLFLVTVAIRHASL